MKRYRFAIFVEEVLGHRTHLLGLRGSAGAETDVEPVWFGLVCPPEEWWARLPGVRRHHSMRMSLSAAARAWRAGIRGRFDAALFHTQSTAYVWVPLMREVPCVVSIDAPPAGTSETGARGLSFAWSRAVFRSAAKVVAWSKWAAAPMTTVYGVRTEDVRVVRPGVDLRAFAPRSVRAEGRVRLLFVGGDFRRKGGDVLAEAIVRAGLAETVEVDLVTPQRAEAEAAFVGAAGLRWRVHDRVDPGSAELKDLLGRADVFVLPTRRDCTPLAILEAMASGLPVISTPVGAVAEQVEEGRTGLLVRPGDADGLATALTRLCADGNLRRSLGAEGRLKAEREFDLTSNTLALLTVMKEAADAALVRRSVAASSGRRAAAEVGL